MFMIRSFSSLNTNKLDRNKLSLAVFSRFRHKNATLSFLIRLFCYSLALFGPSKKILRFVAGDVVIQLTLTLMVLALI